MRAIPGLTVLRPGSDREVAAAWQFALQNKKGPTALVLTRQKLDPLPVLECRAEDVLKGGYVLVDVENPKVILVASGSEVPLAVSSQKLLAAENIPARVVSLPSWERFKEQDTAYRREVLGEPGTPIFVMEAGIRQGWYEVLERPYEMLSIEHFGASAPYKVLAEKFGFTPQQVAERVKAYLNKG